MSSNVSFPGSPVYTESHWEDVRPLRDGLWCKIIKSLEPLLLKGIIIIFSETPGSPHKGGCYKEWAWSPTCSGFHLGIWSHYTNPSVMMPSSTSWHNQRGYEIHRTDDPHTELRKPLSFIKYLASGILRQKTDKGSPFHCRKQIFLRPSSLRQQRIRVGSSHLLAGREMRNSTRTVHVANYVFILA